MVVHNSDLSTWEAEAGRSPGDEDQPGLQSEFQVSRKYKVRPGLKGKKIQANLVFSCFNAELLG